MRAVGDGSRSYSKPTFDGVCKIDALLGQAEGFGNLTLRFNHFGEKLSELMEQTVALHLEKFVTVLGLLDATLEFNQLASGWFDVKRHGFTSGFKPYFQDGTSQSTSGQDERGTWCQ